MALSVLAHIAADEDALAGFLNMTGLSPEDLHQRAADPDLLVGVLDYLMSDEARLLAFCAQAGLEPTAPALARHALPGGAQPHWT